MELFFDTETTGKADFNLRSDDPRQPRVVSLAALLFDHCGELVHSLSGVMKPEGFEIPLEAAGVHGITTEYAGKIGLPRKVILDVFEAMLSLCTVVVGHNIDFDVLVMERELGRVIEKEHFCTMKAATDICRLPGRYGGYKWPKLKEAYRFMFEKELSGAHDALNDIRATKEIYDWIMARRKIGASEAELDRHSGSFLPEGKAQARDATA